MQQQSKQPGGLSNMDWGQLQNMQNVAGGGRFPNGWNNQPGWQRPGYNSNNNNNNWNNMGGGGVGGGGGMNQGAGSPSGSGQPRPGVHPDDWNNNNVPQGPGGGNWPPARPPSPPPPPPNQPPPGWNPPNEDNRKKNKNRRKQQNQLDQDSILKMPSPNPSLNPNVAFDGPTGTQWGGGNMGAINDEESKSMSRNRQYGYAIMACAVVALAVLMVSFVQKCSDDRVDIFCDEI